MSELESMVGILGNAPLSVIILSVWVVTIYRQKTRLMDKLMECVDALKTKNEKEENRTE